MNKKSMNSRALGKTGGAFEVGSGESFVKSPLTPSSCSSLHPVLVPFSHTLSLCTGYAWAHGGLKSWLWLTEYPSERVYVGKHFLCHLLNAFKALVALLSVENRKLETVWSTIPWEKIQIVILVIDSCASLQFVVDLPFISLIWLLAVFYKL